jgi:hypothetical protein
VQGLVVERAVVERQRALDRGDDLGAAGMTDEAADDGNPAGCPDSPGLEPRLASSQLQ